MTQEEKGQIIGGGAKPSFEDDSSREWHCGCYEDQHGYHLCERWAEHWNKIMPRTDIAQRVEQSK